MNNPTLHPDEAAFAEFLNEIKVTKEAPAESLNAGFSMPYDGLPDSFVEYCKHVADRRNVPLDVTLMAALTAAGAAAGANIKSNIAGYENRPGLLTMIVAPSASGKSQPLSDIMQPLYELDRKLLAGYKFALEEWRNATINSKLPKPKPQKTQFICDTSTDAARMEFICDNPRGGILYRDELRAYFKGLSGKFNEQAVEHALEIADFKPVKIHTKGSEEIKATKCSFLPILGGIQSAVLRDTISPEFIANGLLQRFCAVVFDAHGFPKIGEGIAPALADYWSKNIDELHKLGGSNYTFIPSDSAAKVYAAEYDKFCKSYVDDPDASERYNEYRQMAYAKTLYVVHRLALIAHVLKIIDTRTHIMPDIDADTIKWAFSCVPYLVSQKMKVYEIICGKQKPRTDREIIRELAEMMKRKGRPLNQSALAEITGIARPNINQYLRGV